MLDKEIHLKMIAVKPIENAEFKQSTILDSESCRYSCRRALCRGQFFSFIFFCYCDIKETSLRKTFLAGTSRQKVKY